MNKTKWDHLLSIMSEESLKQLARLLRREARRQPITELAQTRILLDDIQREYHKRTEKVAG
jgi:hypothetical protein